MDPVQDVVQNQDLLAQSLPPIKMRKRDRSKDRSGTFQPQIEKGQHRAMFMFYDQLGADRSLPKVAKEFGVSVTWVANLSRTFGWTNRIKRKELEEDPVITSTKSSVDSVRTKLVAVVFDVTDTLYELSQLSSKAKLENLEQLNEVDQKKVTTLNTAMRVYGFDLDKPKALRDLLAVLKEVTHFNDKPPQTSAQPRSLTQINAPNAKLIIHDD